MEYQSQIGLLFDIEPILENRRKSIIKKYLSDVSQGIIMKLIPNNKRQFIRHLLSMSSVSKSRKEPINYGNICWQFFINKLNPYYLKQCCFKDGDTSDSLKGLENKYCIFVSGPEDGVQYINQKFDVRIHCGEKFLNLQKVFCITENLKTLQYRGKINDKGMFTSFYNDNLTAILKNPVNWGNNSQ